MFPALDCAPSELVTLETLAWPVKSISRSFGVTTVTLVCDPRDRDSLPKQRGVTYAARRGVRQS
ncbi:hypothetical protein BN381_290104 [Candidatus Microthrix parvicella RN1]|uniref:Uncharacterized protein n=1 Tax=Candidatus Neomicrothrix parvicella RN1 TaxID=1229780 RepID=R4Z376_9ACTN|nr:hypothetical protein BN381_290104 [Candidatus Microthrix parvicella RN1]